MPSQPANSDKASSSSNNTAKNAPVDNLVLASMLRESAQVVERGEFDPILYTALQDFRTYYKEHYPVKKSTGGGGATSSSSTTPSPSTKEHHSRSRGSSHGNNHNGNSGGGSSSTKSKKKSSTNGDSSKPSSSRSMGSVLSTTSTRTIRHHHDEGGTQDKKDDEDIQQESSQVSPTIQRSTAEPVTSLSPSRNNGPKDDPLLGQHEQQLPPMPVIVEPISPVTATTVPTTTYTGTTTTTSLPNEPIVSVAASTAPASNISSAHSRPATVESTSMPSYPGVSSSGSSEARATSPTAIPHQHHHQQQNSSGNSSTFFGKLKIPLAGHLKKGSDQYRARDDYMEILRGGSMAAQAQSSARRKMDSNGSTEPAQPSAASRTADAPPVAGATRISTNPFDSVVSGEATATPAQPTNPTQASASAAAGAVPAQTLREAAVSSNKNQETHSGGTQTQSSGHHHASDKFTEEIGEELTEGEPPRMNPSKPDFQRPANSASTLIANGWIEQQRRSKMRFVWKEVLASLVAGRNPGEETTLWIQREIINPSTGKKELEALQQIPVKLIERCSYLDYTVDNRFSLKIFNGAEEAVFRCQSDTSAIKWVETLTNCSRISRGGGKGTGSTGTSTVVEEKKETSPPARMSVSELRAICHGAGINTAGMERQQLEWAAGEVLARGTYFPAPAHAQHHPIPVPQPAPDMPPPSSAGPTGPASAVPPVPPSAAGDHMSISELRAICHGAGINTAGMERQQLQRAAKAVQARGTYFPPPNPPMRASPVPQAPSQAPKPANAPPPEPSASERLPISELRAICHGAGINTVGMERQQLERAADEVTRRGTYFDPPPKTSAPSAHAAAPQQLPHPGHHHTSSSVPDDSEAAKRRHAEEVARHEEYNRRMAAAEQEKQQQRQAAAEQEAEQRRRYAEQQAAAAAAQAAWQKQQHEEEQRRRMAAEQQQAAAEQRRRHEEAMRQQQQWQQQQWQQQQWKQQQAQQQQQQQQQQWPPRDQPQSQSKGQQPFPPHAQQQQQQQRPPPQQPQGDPGKSAASEKYAKMANATNEGDGQAAMTRIKHDILINWALQPPHWQTLRSIDVLVTTIHKVFPPALGVKGHDYFTKWKPLSPSEVQGEGGRMDEERLKKAVRKIRFFLHPDKLPKDLNPEQAFMVKMLWDITSDAWEEFEKRKGELDWIHK